MRAVFTAAAESLELLDLVVLVVAIGVAKPVEAAAWPAVYRNVQGAKRMKHALGGGHVHVQFLDGRRFVGANGAGRYPI